VTNSDSAQLPSTERAYRITRLEGIPPAAKVSIGQTVWQVADQFNLAHDDSRYTGIEYVAVSPDLTKEWYFTIPLANLEAMT
jgi:hypothetical protein